MTISDHQIEEASKMGAKLLGMTTIWNHRYSNLNGARTNAFGLATHLLNTYQNVKRVVAIVGAKGRSQHSASQVVLFDVTGLDEMIVANLTGLSNNHDCASYELDAQGNTESL